MLDREEHRLVAGTTVVVVTAIMTPELASTIVRLRRRGHALVVLSTSGDLWQEQLGDTGVRELRARGWTPDEVKAAARRHSG